MLPYKAREFITRRIEPSSTNLISSLKNSIKSKFHADEVASGSYK